MATVRTHIKVDASPDVVWDVFRDVGALHTRLAPGFVTDTRLDGDARHVTFANGVEVTERIVTVDDEARRLAYAITGGTVTHHHASFEVLPDQDERTVVVWTTDVLPDEAADRFRQTMEAGARVMATNFGLQLGHRTLTCPSRGAKFGTRKGG